MQCSFSFWVSEVVHAGKMQPCPLTVLQYLSTWQLCKNLWLHTMPMFLQILLPTIYLHWSMVYRSAKDCGYGNQITVSAWSGSDNLVNRRKCSVSWLQDHGPCHGYNSGFLNCTFKPRGLNVELGLNLLLYPLLCYICSSVIAFLHWKYVFKYVAWMC